jgi:hypothetical protein
MVYRRSRLSAHRDGLSLHVVYYKRQKKSKNYNIIINYYCCCCLQNSIIKVLTNGEERSGLIQFDVY